MCTLGLLRNGLVVSCQPIERGPMDSPEIISAMARAAIAGGADGVRIEGADNVRVVRGSVSEPIVGIVKRDLSDCPVRITPLIEDVASLADAGADIIAFDATSRKRPFPRTEIIGAILERGRLAMADCSSVGDAQRAIELGAHIIGTTLSGYTEETEGSGPEPDIELVRRFKELGAFVMAEGRYATPALARAALAAGADCVTVGTPLTRLETNTAAFRAAMSEWDRSNG